jgi:hypothetical protein
MLQMMRIVSHHLKHSKLEDETLRKDSEGEKGRARGGEHRNR